MGKLNGVNAKKLHLVIFTIALLPTVVLATSFRAQGQNQQSTAAEVDNWIAKLKDPNDDIRYRASEALSKFAARLNERSERSDALVSALRQCVVTDKFHLVRANCAIGLHQSGEFAESAIKELSSALSDPSPLVRGWATRALTAIGPPAKSTVAKIMQGTNDKDSRVRRSSAFAVMELDPTRALQVVKVLVEQLAFADNKRDLQDSVRDEVERYLKRLTGPAAALAVKELQGYQGHPDPGVEGRAKEIIAALGKTP